jgi:hypothetical protein
MTLSQRAQTARDALLGRYDQLNSLWLQAEEQLTRFHIPRPVYFAYRTYERDVGDPSHLINDCLGIQRIKGKWRICHAVDCHPNVDEYNPEWTPIAECSVETRAEAAKYLPQLRERIVETAENFIPVVEKAIAELKKALNVPDEHLKSLLAERAKLNGRAK